MVAAPRRLAALDLPSGLVERVLEGKLLRLELVDAARRRIAAGHHPDAGTVAAAVLREARTSRWG